MYIVMILMSRGGDGAVIDSSRRTPLYYAVEKAGMNILLKGLTWLFSKFIFCLNHWSRMFIVHLLIRDTLG